MDALVSFFFLFIHDLEFIFIWVLEESWEIQLVCLEGSNQNNEENSSLCQLFFFFFFFQFIKNNPTGLILNKMFYLKR